MSLISQTKHSCEPAQMWLQGQLLPATTVNISIEAVWFHRCTTPPALKILLTTLRTSTGPSENGCF